MRLFPIIILFFYLIMSTSVWAQQKLTDEEKQIFEQTNQANQAQTNQAQANQIQANQAQPQSLVGFGLGTPFGHGLMFGSSIKVAEEFDLRIQLGIGLRYVEISALLYYEVKRKHSIGMGYHFNIPIYLASLILESMLETAESSIALLLASSISLLYKYQFTDNEKHEVTIGLSQNLFAIKSLSISDMVKEQEPILFLYTLGYNYKF
jgi:cytochrome c biogenesis factor